MRWIQSPRVQILLACLACVVVIDLYARALCRWDLEDPAFRYGGGLLFYMVLGMWHPGE